jgi:uncharacterized membrane protein
MAFGLATGVLLLVGCELPQARRYAITANALGAAGIVALFSTFFAAHTLWHLLGAGTTFVLMVLVTAVAVGLSIRHSNPARNPFTSRISRRGRPPATTS